jgi:hypothetical protein
MVTLIIIIVKTHCDGSFQVVVFTNGASEAPLEQTIILANNVTKPLKTYMWTMACMTRSNLVSRSEEEIPKCPIHNFVQLQNPSIPYSPRLMSVAISR